jgi:hypothetical protein
MRDDLYEGPMGETVEFLPKEVQRLLAYAVGIRDGKVAAEGLLEERELLPKKTQDMLDAVVEHADKAIEQLFRHAGELFQSAAEVEEPKTASAPTDQSKGSEAVAVGSAA